MKCSLALPPVLYLRINNASTLIFIVIFFENISWYTSRFKKYIVMLILNLPWHYQIITIRGCIEFCLTTIYEYESRRTVVKYDSNDSNRLRQIRFLSQRIFTKWSRSTKLYRLFNYFYRPNHQVYIYINCKYL